MRLTVIGCSGSIPGPDSPASCYLLEAEGFRLLLDLGNGAVGALQRHADPGAVDAVCLSHLHADHCLDMAPFYVARTYGPSGPRPPIPVHAPQGAGERLAGAYGPTGDRPMSAAFGFAALAEGRWELGPFAVTTARVNHPVETYGFRIEHAGRSLAYSADTGESPALVRLAHEADLLLCEASFIQRPGLPADLHLTGGQAAWHAARAGARRLLLTHVPPWHDPARVLEESSGVGYEGIVSLAAPGQAVEI